MTKLIVYALTAACSYMWLVRVPSNVTDEMAPLGIVMAWIATVRFVNTEPGKTRVLSVASLGLLFVFGLTGLQPGPQLLLHLVWSLSLVAIAVSRARARARIPGGGGLFSSISTGLTKLRAKRDARRAEQKKVADARDTELRHAAKIHREQNWREQAVGPGTTTGYEPAALSSVVSGSSPHTYGAPGLALQHARGRGAARAREGHDLFARALTREGLIDRFAIFWHVQLPEDGAVGANSQTSAAVDCVILTGRSLWLIDVKNYAQGGVRWLTDGTDLVATDTVDGGQVGETRVMGPSISTARDRWQAKVSAVGLRTRVKAAVTLLPRDTGLGEISGLTWTGGVPIQGLPQLLDFLKKEPAFDSGGNGMDLLVPMLRVLVQTEAGHAPRPGERQRSYLCPQCRTRLTTQALADGFCHNCAAVISGTAAPNGTAAPSGAAPPSGGPSGGNAQPHGSSGGVVCPSCGHEPSSDEVAASFCFTCVSPL